MKIQCIPGKEFLKRRRVKAILTISKLELFSLQKRVSLKEKRRSQRKIEARSKKNQTVTAKQKSIGSAVYAEGRF